MTLHSSRAGAAVACALIFSACSSNNNDDGFVTITGVAINLDTGMGAPGVRVSMLDGSGSAEVATGDDGRWTMRVPKGALFETLVDDFSTSGADEWVPMINVDYPGVTITESRGDLIVHGCPRPGFHEGWSADAWNGYLAGCSDPALPHFNTPTMEESGGILVLLPRWCDQGTLGPPAGLNLTVDNPAFPLGFVDAVNFPDNYPCYFFPSTTTTVQPDNGIVWSFGDSSFAGGDITISATDTNPSRGLVFQDAVVPMVPGMATLVWLGAVNEQGSRHFLEVFCACNRPAPVDCAVW